MSQDEYIAILVNDVQFASLKQRNAWLSLLFQREIHATDELSKTEKSFVIDKLKEMKANRANAIN